METTLKNVPVIIIRERRNGYRASFTKKGLTIRIDSRNSSATEQEQIDAAMLWAKAMVAKKPTIAQRYKRPAYETGMQLHTISGIMTINTHFKERKSYKAVTNDNTLSIIIPLNEDYRASRKQSLAVSSALSNFYKPMVVDRLSYWQRFLGKPYNQLSIKYNESNWGSCSLKGNINLSSRLLLTTMNCLDYVLVHELCHLQHFNHSPQFWALVEKIMPSYQERQKELASYSHKAYM